MCTTWIDSSVMFMFFNHQFVSIFWWMIHQYIFWFHDPRLRSLYAIFSLQHHKLILLSIFCYCCFLLWFFISIFYCCLLLLFFVVVFYRCFFSLFFVNVFYHCFLSLFFINIFYHCFLSVFFIIVFDHH